MHLSNDITEAVEGVQSLLEALGSIRFLQIGDSGAERYVLYTFPSMIVVTLLLPASLMSLTKMPIRI